MLERAAGAFSVSDGPYLAVLRRVHLTRRDRTPRASVLVAIAWVPLVVGGLAHLLAGRRPPEILWDLSVHARLLIVIPLIVHAGRLLERRCASSVAQLYSGGFVEPAQLDPIVTRAIRLRRSRVVELAIAAVVLIGGQATLWRLGGRSGAFSGVSDTHLSFAHVWYATVALPLTQFLYCDWLWQWLIWSYLVVRVSRLRLSLIATHPDASGGIGFLGEEPLTAFTLYVLASSTIMAAAWCTRVLEQGAPPDAFVAPFLCVVAFNLLLAFGPLCLYGPMLYRTRFRDTPRYDELALEYVRGFDRKWVEGHPDEQPLVGSPDVQSLSDMIKSVDHVRHLRVVPFGPREMIMVWVAAALPMLPLVAVMMPTKDLLEKLAEGVLAGLPV